MIEDENMCEMFCPNPKTECMQAMSIISQSIKGGIGEKGKLIPLPVNAMRVYLGQIINNGFYAECRNKRLLLATMEDVLPGSTSEIQDPE